MTHPNGTRYEGEWLEGFNHGQGKLVYPDGKEEQGIWANGRQISRFNSNIATTNNNANITDMKEVTPGYNENSLDTNNNHMMLD